MSLVADFDAVWVEWQPASLLQTRFAQSAGSPEGFEQLAHDFFHHANWPAEGAFTWNQRRNWPLSCACSVFSLTLGMA